MVISMLSYVFPIKLYHSIYVLFIVADFHKVHLSVYNIIILCVVTIVVASDNLISYPCRHVVANHYNIQKKNKQIIIRRHGSKKVV